MNQDLTSDSSIRDIVEDAIKFCQANYNRNEDEIVELLKEDDKEVNTAFRCYIAERIAEYFALHEINVIAAYLFGSLVNEKRTVYCSDIDIILNVDEKRKEYSDLIKKTGNQLTKEIARKIGKPFDKDFNILDVKPVTQEDIDNKRVFACLINSIYDPAYKIYPK